MPTPRIQYDLVFRLTTYPSVIAFHEQNFAMEEKTGENVALVCDNKYAKERIQELDLQVIH